MNTTRWIDLLHTILTQANIAGVAQGEPGALYVEDEELCLLIEAERNRGFVDITVTGLPLTASGALLQSMPLFLIADAWLRYGVFNQRGQISFKQVALQPFQLSTTEAAQQIGFHEAYVQRFSSRSLPLATGALVLLPTVALAPMRQAVLAKGNGAFHCANADGTIQVLLQKGVDDRIGFTFQSQKRLWEQNPVGLYQSKRQQRNAAIGAEANTMQWDTSQEQYCATITVETALLQEDGFIALPLQPLPLELWNELAEPQPVEAVLSPAGNRSTQVEPQPGTVMPTAGGLLASVSEAVRRVWVRDTQNVIWINFVEGFLGQSAMQPALVVKGDPPGPPGTALTQFSLGPDELGDLDLSVQAIVEENPALCTLIVKAQIPSRWPLVNGVRVILLRNEEFCRADTDESGEAFFPALPIEQLKRIGFKIELVDPPE